MPQFSAPHHLVAVVVEGCHRLRICSTNARRDDLGEGKVSKQRVWVASCRVWYNHQHAYSGNLSSRHAPPAPLRPGRRNLRQTEPTSMNRRVNCNPRPWSQLNALLRQPESGVDQPAHRRKLDTKKLHWHGRLISGRGQSFPGSHRCGDRGLRFPLETLVKPADEIR